MYQAVIIDDEKWVVKSLLATIKGQTFFEIIGEAYDGVTGLSLIETKKPDLAFVDIQIPGMGGLELLKAAQLAGLPTVFIVISGHAEFAYAQKAMLYNAIGYCLKPFSKSELMDAMEKACHLIESQKSKEIKKEEVYPVTPPPLKVGNKMVNKMLEYMHENYQQDISIQNLADLCNINQNYASQLFSQEVGEPFSTYLTNLRIQQSMDLLRSTDLPVAQISIAVGYKDYFYFAKVFKRTAGVTPTAFRNDT